MTVSQIYTLVNTAKSEALGESAVLNEDLSNLVDVGTSILNANAYDNYVRSLVNQVGKMIFVDRQYRGVVPSVLMDGWTYGSVLEKVRTEMPQAIENEDWELQDGASYDPNIFYKPKINAKFFNKRAAFTVPISITEKQVQESFQSAYQMNGFISLIYVGVENALTLATENLVKRTINNFIGETINAEYGSTDVTTTSKTKAVNLLYLYNQRFSTTLTQAECLNSKEFIRFACYTMSVYMGRLASMSTMFNIGATERFTPSDVLHVVMHSDFKAAAGIYLYSDTFHDTYVKLPEAEEIPFWQGTGTTYAFADTSSINVVTASNNATVNISGILGIMFDRDALGIQCPDKRKTSGYNPVGNFFNYWNKSFSGYFNDLNENFIVFFAA